MQDNFEEGVNVLNFIFITTTITIFLTITTSYVTLCINEKQDYTKEDVIKLSTLTVIEEDNRMIKRLYLMKRIRLI